MFGKIRWIDTFPRIYVLILYLFSLDIYLSIYTVLQTYSDWKYNITPSFSDLSSLFQVFSSQLITNFLPMQVSLAKLRSFFRVCKWVGKRPRTLYILRVHYWLPPVKLHVPNLYHKLKVNSLINLMSQYPKFRSLEIRTNNTAINKKLETVMGFKHTRLGRKIYFRVPTFLYSCYILIYIILIDPQTKDILAIISLYLYRTKLAVQRHK